MYTRCTHCDTVFRVTPQQLQVSSGTVRCGRCSEVFDAFSSLSAQLPSAVHAEFDAHAMQRFEIPPPPDWSLGEQDAIEAPEPADSPLPGQDEGERASLQTPEPAPEPDLDFVSAAADQQPPLPAAPEVVVQEGSALTLPDELFAQPGRPGSHWAWWAGGAMLAVLAAAQLTWVFATPLAHRMPGMRPALEAFCTGFGCTVALPRLKDDLFIEASDLQVLDASRPNEVLLTVSLRNRARIAQAYPLLELTLTGPANQVSARKVFQPREYLERDVDSGRGIGANQEVSIRLYLNTGTLRPAGYRLFVFFA